MALVKNFKKLLEEVKNMFEVTHQGIVLDNDDPLKLGRIKVSIGPWEDLEDEFIPWCSPEVPCFLGNSKQSLALFIPEKGSTVEIFFPNRDKYHPRYKGTFLTDKNVDKTNVLYQNYPNSYGFVDSILNFFKINKFTKEAIFQHSSGTNIKIIENGDITTTHVNGSKIHIIDDEISLEHNTGSKVKLTENQDIEIISSDDNYIKLVFEDNIINIECDTINIGCNNANIEAVSAVTLVSPSVSMTTNLVVTGNITSTGGVVGLSVTDVNGTMQDMRDIYNSHTHTGDSGGTTGTPNSNM